MDALDCVTDVLAPALGHALGHVGEAVRYAPMFVQVARVHAVAVVLDVGLVAHPDAQVAHPPVPSNVMVAARVAAIHAQAHVLVHAQIIVLDAQILVLRVPTLALALVGVLVLRSVLVDVPMLIINYVRMIVIVTLQYIRGVF